MEWTETVAEDTRKKMAWSTAMNPEDCALGMTIECNHLCAVRGARGGPRRSVRYSTGYC